MVKQFSKEIIFISVASDDGHHYEIEKLIVLFIDVHVVLLIVIRHCEICWNASNALENVNYKIPTFLNWEAVG